MSANVPYGPDLYYALYMGWKPRLYRAGDVWESRAVVYEGEGMDTVRALLE